MIRGLKHTRNWTCIDCRTPETATRVGSRCPACKVEHHRRAERIRRAERQQRRDALDRQQASRRRRSQQRRLETKRAKASAIAEAPISDAIALYRAEKAKKAHRDEAMLADARRLFLVLEEGMKPKRGRPKKSLSPLDTRAAA